MEQIKTIIFDFGGVIITLDQPQAIRRFQEIGLKDADQRLDAYTQGGIFGDLERGTIDAETFRVELSKLVGREVSYDECWATVANCPSAISMPCADCAAKATV